MECHLQTIAPTLTTSISPALAASNNCRSMSVPICGAGSSIESKETCVNKKYKFGQWKHIS